MRLLLESLLGLFNRLDHLLLAGRRVDADAVAVGAPREYELILRKVGVDLGNHLRLGNWQRLLLHYKRHLLELVWHHVLHHLRLVGERHVGLLHLHVGRVLLLHEHVFFLHLLHVVFVPLLLVERAGILLHVLKLHSVLKALWVVAGKNHVLRHAELLRQVHQVTHVAHSSVVLLPLVAFRLGLASLDVYLAILISEHMLLLHIDSHLHLQQLG